MPVRKVRITITDKDKGFKALVRMLDKLANNKLQVKAGLLGKSRQFAPSGPGVPDVVMLGAIHEFGVAKGSVPGRPWMQIPSRPWIRNSWDRNAAKTQQLLRKAIGKCYDGKLTPYDALNLVGFSMVADINRYVRGPNDLRPLAESTKAAKLRHRRGKGPKASRAMPKALIDTARMLNAVTHEVTKR